MPFHAAVTILKRRRKKRRRPMSSSPSELERGVLISPSAHSNMAALVLFTPTRAACRFRARAMVWGS